MTLGYPAKIPIGVKPERPILLLPNLIQGRERACQMVFVHFSFGIKVMYTSF